MARAIWASHPPSAPRRRACVDHSAPRSEAEVVDGAGPVEIGGYARGLAGEVGADHGPVVATVLRAEDLLAREVQHARVAAREGEGQGPRAPPLVGPGE